MDICKNAFVAELPRYFNQDVIKKTECGLLSFPAGDKLTGMRKKTKK